MQNAYACAAIAGSLLFSLLFDPGDANRRKPALAGNAPPTVTSSLPQGSPVYFARGITTYLAPNIPVPDNGDSLVLQLVVRDPDGDAVELRLLNLLGETTLERVGSSPSEAVYELRWLPDGFPPDLVLPDELFFEATDGTHRVRFTQALRHQLPGPILNVGDVTGDGVLDVVHHDRFFPTPLQVRIYSHELFPAGVPFVTIPDNGFDRGVRLRDLTGDGVLDVILGGPDVWIFPGGPDPGRFTADVTRLTSPGSLSNGKIELADVTGDSVLDVVGRDNVGLHVWPGPFGPGVVPAPFQLLATPDFDSFRLADVTGDGVLDILHLSIGQRKIHVYAGGASIAATPVTVLQDSDGFSTDWVSALLVLADFTGDGLDDVILGAENADVGAPDAGVVLVWRSPLASGSVDPTWELGSANPVAGESQTLSVVGDVHGDGIVDVVGGAGLPGEFELRIWQGGAGQGQRFEPTATLRVPGGITGPGAFFDVTGDGVTDVILGAEDGFALRVWRGGPTLAGEPAPVARLVTNGLRMFSVHGSDLTGDGIFDVFSNLLDESGSFTFIVSGHVWEGSAGLAGDLQPRATLPTKSSRILRFVDLTGDGIDDALTSFAGLPFSPRFLGHCLFAGGAALTGAVEATATLESSSSQLDWFDNPQSYWIEDVDRNGVLDFIMSGFRVRQSGTAFSFFRHDIAVFAGGPELQGFRPTPVATARQEGTGFSVKALAEVTGDGRPDLLSIQNDFVRVWAELHTSVRPFLLGPR